jgi:hypothetical protein
MLVAKTNNDVPIVVQVQNAVKQKTYHPFRYLRERPGRSANVNEATLRDIKLCKLHGRRIRGLFERAAAERD